MIISLSPLGCDLTEPRYAVVLANEEIGNRSLERFLCSSNIVARTQSEVARRHIATYPMERVVHVEPGCEQSWWRLMCQFSSISWEAFTLLNHQQVVYRAFEEEAACDLVATLQNLVPYEGRLAGVVTSLTVYFHPPEKGRMASLRISSNGQPLSAKRKKAFLNVVKPLFKKVLRWTVQIAEY